eukprot:3593353-Alexandrium_andersonii.AAC.1
MNGSGGDGRPRENNPQEQEHHCMYTSMNGDGLFKPDQRHVPNCMPVAIKCALKEYTTNHTSANAHMCPSTCDRRR